MPSDEPSPSAHQPERPLRKGERTRQRILRAAGQLLSSTTPAAIKMEDIAYEADLSVGALYKHFPGKEALFLAFTAESYAVLDRYREGIAELPSPLQRVYAAGDAYLRFAVERPTFVRFMMLRGLQPVGDESLAELNKSVSGKIQELVLQAGIDLRESMQTREIPAAPLDEMVVMLFGLWNGVAGLVVRADTTAIPAELAWRAVERSRTILHRAIAHEFQVPDAPGPPWEPASAAPSSA